MVPLDKTRNLTRSSFSLQRTCWHGVTTIIIGRRIGYCWLQSTLLVDDEVVGKLKGLLAGLYADYLPKGLAVVQDGKKWIIADRAKAGKLVLDKTTGSLNLEKSKFTGNMAGLKLTYKDKDGTFKGSFKVYNLEDGKKIKTYTANVTGVMIGVKGYGTATIKKTPCTFLVTIE